MKLILLVVCFVLSNAQTIPELAEKLGAKTLVNLVKDAGLADTLSGQGPFTVFGPTDAAFAALPPAVLNKLMNDKKLLESVLLFHVLSGKVYSSQLTNDMTAATLNGAKVRVNIYGQTVTVDGSKVVLADENATNGVIHVIDKVLADIPTQNIVQFAAGQKDFSSLVFLVISAKLGATLSGGPFTLFAPTNEAFNKLPPDAINKLLQNQTALIEVLTYHVVKGTVYSIGLSNGMVPTVEGKSVKVDLSSGGPFTLFAPTNEAFNKLPPDAINKLLQNQTALIDVLTYHVVKGTVYSVGLSNGMVPTVEGKSVKVELSSGGVMINDAKVTMANVPVTNGVIHVIDTVLLPPK